MKLGDTFPTFSAVTNLGKIKDFHDWIGNSWVILFSHPADFTPVCTTELARAVQLAEKFEERQVQMIALSCDSAESHRSWIRDILAYAEYDKCFSCSVNNFPFEIIADENRRLATELGMLDPKEKDSAGIPLTARAVFIIDPEKKLRAQILYPATTGRNFDEILRVIDSLQLTDRMPVATPEGWNSAKEACMVQPSVSMSEAEELFAEVDTVPLPSGKPYLRRVQIIE
uniref:Thioredoxin domain-containing protein n=1 Tax=Angiostrongylus cantonensis TaxID=6313 RepID=A0A0K0DNX6_ANGCA